MDCNFYSFFVYFSLKDKNLNVEETFKLLIKLVTNVAHFHRRGKMRERKISTHEKTERFSFELIRHDLLLIFALSRAFYSLPWCVYGDAETFKRDFHLITLIVCVSKHMLCKILMKILSMRNDTTLSMCL